MDAELAVQAVENLVTQFSSSLDFYRELVQNSIDAGSVSVDVWTEHIPGDEDGGTIAIHVDDGGEGMNEAIIDDQLTKLFASRKEDDLTKIGKFGIGFVSVFALGPEAVLVHTGRDGEYWEICFDVDRSFVKTRVDTPVDGTQITLFVNGDRGRYKELVEGTRETLTRWCSHSDVEVTFEDRSSDGDVETINQPFVVPGACLARSEGEGAEVVCAFSRAPVYGFYNKGLALAFTSEGERVLGGRYYERFAHVAFKIKSCYLEHTLSRDTVVHDESYDRAMRLVEDTVRGPLRTALLAEIAALVGRSSWSLADTARYHELLGYLVAEPLDALDDAEREPILRTVEGAAISLDALWSAVREDGRLFVSDVSSELSQTLAEDNVPVLFGRTAADRADVDAFGAVAQLAIIYLSRRQARGLTGKLRSLFGFDHRSKFAAMLTSPEGALMRIRVDERAPSDAAGLIADADDLLGEVKARYRRLVSCTLAVLTADPPLFVVGRRIRPLMALPPPGEAVIGERPRRPEAAVNREHPHFMTLLKLRERSPAMAAYCLAKDLLLAEDRLLERDLELIGAALPDERAEYREGPS